MSPAISAMPGHFIFTKHAGRVSRAPHLSERRRVWRSYLVTVFALDRTVTVKKVLRRVLWSYITLKHVFAFARAPACPSRGVGHSAHWPASR